MTLKIVGIGASYIFIFLITHNFGSEGWGRYSLAISFIMFCILIGKAGFDLALLKFTSANEATNERYISRSIYFKGISFCMSISIALTLILVFYSDDIAILFFNKPYLSDHIFYTSFLIILHVNLLINSEGLRGLNKNISYLVIQYVGIYLLGSILLFFLLKYQNRDSLLPLQVLVISSFIIFLLSNYLWFKEILKVQVPKSFSFPLKKILKVSYPMFISNAMFVFLNWTDTLLLGFYQVDESEIGIYSIALKVSGIISLPLLAVSAILASKVSELFTIRNFSALQKLVTESTRLVFVSSAIIFLLFITFPSFILSFFGKDFSVGEGITVLIILSIGFLIKSFSGCTDILLQMTNNERLFQNIIVVATILNLILNIVLIPIWGILGSAIANLASMFLWNFASIYYIKKRLNLNSAFTIL